MRPGGLNFLFTLSHSPPICSLFEEAVSSPTTSCVIFARYCLGPSPNSQPFWPEGSSTLAGQIFPIGFLSLLTFLYPVTTPSRKFSFLYLFLASPSPKADKDSGMRGSGREAGARADGRRAAPGVLQTFRRLSPWEEEDRSWGHCGWGV